MTTPAQAKKTLGRIAYEASRRPFETLSLRDEWWNGLTSVQQRGWEAAAQEVFAHAKAEALRESVALGKLPETIFLQRFLKLIPDFDDMTSEWPIEDLARLAMDCQGHALAPSPKTPPAEGVSFGQWIACSDRLPEPKQIILIWHKNTMIEPALGYVVETNNPPTNRTWITMNTTWASGVHLPTHWMPLPPPPAQAEVGEKEL